MLLRQGENIRAVDLLPAGRLLGLEEEGLAFGDVHHKNGARVGDAGVVEEVVVLTIVNGFRERLAGEKNEVAGLELLAEFRAATGEFLGPAEIVDRSWIGVLSAYRKNAERDHDREYEANEGQIHRVLRKTRKCTSRGPASIAAAWRSGVPAGRARRPSLHYVESGSQPALFLATYLKSLIAYGIRFSLA